MELAVLWTDTAKETYSYVLTYLDDFWGAKYVNDFIDRTEKILNLIAKNPFIFKSVADYQNVRRGMLHQNCSFLYRVNKSQIELLVFWDSRQDPFL